MPIIEQLRIEDEQERQDRGAHAVEERRDAGLDRVRARDRGSRKGGQPDGGCHVRHQTEIEDEHVHGDERHQEPRLRAEFDHHGGHQRRDHDVVRRGRQTHAEDQADDGHQQQHDHQVAARDQLDELGHHQADAGEGHGADDDAGGGGGHADADHVARTDHQAVEQFAESERQRPRRTRRDRGKTPSAAAG